MTVRYQAVIRRVLCWVDPNGKNLGPVNPPKPPKPKAPKPPKPPKADK